MVFFSIEGEKEFKKLHFWGNSDKSQSDKSQDKFIDCKPILKNYDSLISALEISKLLNQNDYELELTNIDGQHGGFLRLILELIYCGFDYQSIKNKKIKELLKNCNKLFLPEKNDEWENQSEEDIKEYFNNTDEKFETLRKKIEWLFNGARNEYLIISETLKISKGLE